MKLGLHELMNSGAVPKPQANRRIYIGGSDAKIIMSADEQALIRLWREKRGEIEPEDLSGNHRPARQRHRGPEQDLVRAL